MKVKNSSEFLTELEAFIDAKIRRAMLQPRPGAIYTDNADLDIYLDQDVDAQRYELLGTIIDLDSEN